MPQLRGKAGTGLGVRIPIRVEDAETGTLVTTTVSDREGMWSVELPWAGRFVVAEEGGRRYEIETAGAVTSPATDGAGTVGERHARRVAALRDAEG